MTAPEQLAGVPTFGLSPDGVTAALAALPYGSEDIAIRLLELGIRGQRDNDCACPIATYLLRSIPDSEYVQVGGAEAYIKGVLREDLGDGFIQSWDIQLHAELPAGVACLVEDFDNGIYPDLIEEQSHA